VQSNAGVAPGVEQKTNPVVEVVLGGGVFYLGHVPGGL
jgi:hypothetical protein